MKIKGFTLIELLAVIVILAIIALIATPIILGIINNVREESNKRSIELYANAVRNAIASYQLINLDTPKIFSDLNVEYRGDIDCRVKELYEDGSFYLEGCKVNKSENEYSYGTKKEINKACALQDLDQDGKASLSDVVTCGSESFYVMTNENNEITMLSMYNLDVGSVITVDSDYTIISNELIENPTNKQSELAIGGDYDSSIWYATTSFSNTNYWETNVSEYIEYVYNNNSNLYEYVMEYERILTEELNVKSAKTLLISYEQLQKLGCDSSKWSCGPNLGHGEVENPAPSWVYLTNYWSGSANDSGTVWCVGSNSLFGPNIYDSGIAVGVRPVVTISISEI